MALHSRHPQKTPIHASTASSQFVTEMPSVVVSRDFMRYTWSSEMWLLGPVSGAGLPIGSVPSGLGKRSAGPARPPFHPRQFIQGPTAHRWLRTQHCKGRFLCGRPKLQPPSSQLLPLELQSCRQCLRLPRVFSTPPPSHISSSLNKGITSESPLSKSPWWFVNLAGRGPAALVLPLSWSQAAGGWRESLGPGVLTSCVQPSLGCDLDFVCT